METNQLSVHINADAQQVWTMLREPSLLAQWHGWETDSLEAEIRQIYSQGVHAADDHRRLELGMGDVFTLDPVLDGTVLTLQRGQATGEVADYDADITEGWTMFLQQLRFAVEHHPQGRRRTIYREAASARATPIWERLGIDTGWLPDPGEAYELTLNNGLNLVGSLWYRTNHQVGLTVRDYAAHGDGLLILAQQPPIPGVRETHGTQVVISTYDMGAAAFKETAAAWDAMMAGIH